jgi:hypothetical protein
MSALQQKAGICAILLLCQVSTHNSHRRFTLYRVVFFKGSFWESIARAYQASPNIKKQGNRHAGQ